MRYDCVIIKGLQTLIAIEEALKTASRVREGFLTSKQWPEGQVSQVKKKRKKWKKKNNSICKGPRVGKSKQGTGKKLQEVQYDWSLEWDEAPLPYHYHITPLLSLSIQHSYFVSFIYLCSLPLPLTTHKSKFHERETLSALFITMS